MAVPIIIGAAAVGSALYGAYKSTKGVMNKKEAGEVNEQATEMVDSANASVEKQREATNAVLTDYGNRKLRAFQANIPAFIAAFEQLKNVEFTDSVELDKLNQGDFSTTVLSDLKNGYEMLQASGLGLTAGAAGGAAMAFGAYSGTMMLASASTGTAISALSGAAATNATLAWLGGGSLAAGGFGVAGGTMVLGGIVAGPALAILGHFVGNAGEEALNNARSNLEQAQTIRDESALMVKKLTTIAEVVGLANQAFSRINRELRRSVDALESVISAQGTNYAAFDAAARATVLRAVKCAQLTKAMVDTPILDEAGNLVLSTRKAQALQETAGNADADDVLALLASQDTIDETYVSARASALLAKLDALDKS